MGRDTSKREAGLQDGVDLNEQGRIVGRVLQTPDQHESR